MRGRPGVSRTGRFCALRARSLDSPCPARAELFPRRLCCADRWERTADGLWLLDVDVDGVHNSHIKPSLIANTHSTSLSPLDFLYRRPPALIKSNNLFHKSYVATMSQRDNMLRKYLSAPQPRMPPHTDHSTAFSSRRTASERRGKGRQEFLWRLDPLYGFLRPQVKRPQRH